MKEIMIIVHTLWIIAIGLNIGMSVKNENWHSFWGWVSTLILAIGLIFI